MYLFYFIISLMSRVLANGPGDRVSIPGQVPKTLKTVLDAALLSTQNYKVRINGRVEKYRKRSSALPFTSVLQLLKKRPSGHPRLRSSTSSLHFIYYCLFFVFLFFRCCFLFCLLFLFLLAVAAMAMAVMFYKSF